MLTKEQWKQAPTWARAHIRMHDGRYCFVNNVLKNHTDEEEPRPFDTYPCPFCGGTDIQMMQYDMDFTVLCQQKDEQDNHCACGPTRNSETEAWEAWAKRI